MRRKALRGMDNQEIDMTGSCQKFQRSIKFDQLKNDDLTRIFQPELVINIEV
jgi:hypothetical protein